LNRILCFPQPWVSVDHRLMRNSRVLRFRVIPSSPTLAPPRGAFGVAGVSQERHCTVRNRTRQRRQEFLPCVGQRKRESPRPQFCDQVETRERMEAFRTSGKGLPFSCCLLPVLRFVSV
jgi:hypothetical protein